MGNCVRSQAAEAIARHSAADVIEAESAGVRPLGFIDVTIQSVLLARGISMAGQKSKGLHAHSLLNPDLTINMSGIPGERLFSHRKFEDWIVADPFGEDVETHSRICDDIEARVLDLAARLRAQRISPQGGE